MSAEAPTPQTIDEFSDDEIEDFNREQETRLDATLREGVRDLDDEQRDALDALTTPDDEDRETVELKDGVEVTVKTYLSGDIEDKLTAINEQDETDLDPVRAEIIDVLAWVIEDEQYSDRAVWREFARLNGLTGLSTMFFKAVEPALDRQEALKNSHGRSAGR